MGVVNTKSTSVTNADATPVVHNNPFVEGGLVRCSVGTVEVAAADDDTSTYRMCRIPSNARIISAHILCDAITGGTSYDLGFWDTAANGAAVITGGTSVLASAVDLSSAITTVNTEHVFEAMDIAKIEKRAWELTSLTVDPMKEFDVVLSANTVGTGAGTISLVILWAV